MYRRVREDRSYSNGIESRPSAGAPPYIVRVIALPQRGQLVWLEAQVVPQEEQVEQTEPDEQLWPMPFTHAPLYIEQLQAEPFDEAEELWSCAQADCGNSGSEKNSSQTFSANSSHGGIGQKP